MSKMQDGILKNLSWKFAERILAQIVTFIVSIILARLLEPSHYGTIAIVTIFITLANVFVSHGFGNALIQKKDTDDLDYSSVLYFNIFFSIILYLILFFSAPYISQFYGKGYEILTPVLRVMGLRLILAGINSVQHAYVAKNMMFRRFFWSTLGGTVVSAIVGITMAYSGFGVWALAAQYLTNTTVDTIVLAIVNRKLHIAKFSFNRLKQLFSYGSKILATGLLMTGYKELRALIIGKVYSPADLAYFDKGRQFPNLIVTNVEASLSSVLFPKMANEQDNIEAVKNTTRNSIRLGSYVFFPMMLGLAAVADSFVFLVLTEKWMPCVNLLKVFCVTYLFQPIHIANMQAIKAIGRSDIYLKLEIIKKSLELVILIIVMWISVEAIAISMAVQSILFIIVNTFPNRKLLNYSLREQLKDIFPSLSIAVLMFFFASLGQLLPFHRLIVLIIQILAGIVFYLIASIITKNKEFEFLKSMTIKTIKKVF